MIGRCDGSGGTLSDSLLLLAKDRSPRSYTLATLGSKGESYIVADFPWQLQTHRADLACANSLGTHVSAQQSSASALQPPSST